MQKIKKLTFLGSIILIILNSCGDNKNIYLNQDNINNKQIIINNEIDTLSDNKPLGIAKGETNISHSNGTGGVLDF